MKKLWFRRKIYGWGWYPCSLNGWLITLSYIILLIIGIKIFEVKYSSNVILPFFIWTTILTTLLLLICIKTGEKPAWQWGKYGRKIKSRS